MRLVPAIVALCLAVAPVGGAAAPRGGSIPELLGALDPRRHLRRRAGSRRGDRAIIVTADRLRPDRRQRGRRALQGMDVSNRDRSGDRTGNDATKQSQSGAGGDGSTSARAAPDAYRSWGQSSGQPEGAGYGANGYHNGYVDGQFDATLYNDTGAGPTGDHSYLGCLGLSSYELQHEWKFAGTPPACSYVHHSHKGGSNPSTTTLVAENATQGAASCNKSGWFSGCSGGSRNSSGWSSYYHSVTSQFGGSNHATNATNLTASSLDGAEEGQTEAVGGEAGEGQEGEPEEENSVDEQAGDNEQDEVKEQEMNDAEDADGSDDGKVLTNENFENVNGDDFVYESSSTTTKNGTSTWWNKWTSNKHGTSAINGTDSNTNSMEAEDAQSALGSDGEAEQNINEADEAGEEEVDNTQYDPYDDFNLEQCDTYQNLWLWDLSLTCKNSKSLASCECSFAEELLYEGKFSCEDYIKCPTDCAVCRTCFQLMGCVKSHYETNALTVASGGSSSGAILGALAFITLGAAGFVVMRRKRKSPAELGAHLMDASNNSKISYDMDSYGSSPWGHFKQQVSENFQLFEDYYKGTDGSDSGRVSDDSPQHLAQNGSYVSPSPHFGDTNALGGSIASEDAATTSDSGDEGSETSDYETTLDGSDETGAQKIWLAPVDVKLDHQEHLE